MSFLTIDGIDAQVHDETFTMNPEKIGLGVTRAADGSARNSYSSRKHHAKGQTISLDQAHAVFLAALLDGMLDHWTFADLYSDKGVASSNSSGATLTAGGGRNASNKLTLAATTGQATWAAIWPAGVGLTMLVGRFESAAWHDYAITWDATGTLQAVYRDGVAQAVSLPTWIVMAWAALTIRIQQTAGTTQDYCELALVYAQGPTDNLATLNTWRAANNMTSTPSAVTCAGDFHPTALTMEGVVGDTSQHQVVFSGVLADNARVVPFELFEV